MTTSSFIIAPNGDKDYNKELQYTLWTNMTELVEILERFWCESKPPPPRRAGDFARLRQRSLDQLTDLVLLAQVGLRIGGVYVLPRHGTRRRRPELLRRSTYTRCMYTPSYKRGYELTFGFHSRIAIAASKRQEYRPDFV